MVFDFSQLTSLRFRLISAVSNGTALIRREFALVVGFITLVIFTFYGNRWFGEDLNFLLAFVLFAWLFIVMTWGAFSVVRHADNLAVLLGEPYGTLILTMSVVSIEVALISAIMLTGEASPTLARETMFAVLMIILNGFVAGALLVGAFIHQEQDYNLQGARSFLSVLVPLSVFSLILPDFTVSTATPTFTTGQTVFFALITALLYMVFLAMQTGRHRRDFIDRQHHEVPRIASLKSSPLITAAQVGYHVSLLLLTLFPIILLSKFMAKIVDFGVVSARMPIAMGGIIIALLVLLPEGLAALGAARKNHLQRSVNILLGSALSTIGLTVPAVLIVGLITQQVVILGLDQVSMILLVLTLVLSSFTFGGARTNLLQGAVHLVIFFAYIVLIFNP